MRRTTSPTQAEARADLTAALAAATPAMRIITLLLASTSDKLTPTAAKRAIRTLPPEARKGFVITRDLDLAIELAEQVRRMRSFPRRTGARPFYARHPEAKANAALAERFLRPVRQRLTEHVVTTVRKAAERTIRHGAPGGTIWDIEYAPAGELPRYDLECERVYDVYRGAYKGWSANRDVHTIRIPRNWLTRVRRVAKDGVAGECLVLDAERLVEVADGTRAIYQVLIARKGNGYRAVVETRYASCWPYGVTTLHLTERAATNEDVPVEVGRRERTARHEEIQRALKATCLDARDAEAFAALEHDLFRRSYA